MNTKVTQSFDDEFDFGFSVVNEDDLPQVQELKLAQDDIVKKAIAEESNSAVLQKQLQSLYNSIIPLLKNLKTNPDKDYILWPDRSAKIDSFKKKIDNIVGDSVKRKEI